MQPEQRTINHRESHGGEETMERLRISQSRWDVGLGGGWVGFVTLCKYLMGILLMFVSHPP